MIIATIGAEDLIVVFVVALVVFGPKRLPEVGRQAGMAMRELRKLSNDFIGSVTGLHDEPVDIRKSLTKSFSLTDHLIGEAPKSTAALKLDEPKPFELPTQRQRGLTLSALPPEEAAEETKP